MKPAKFSRFVFALLVAGLSLGFNPSLADGLPKDTNKIESLTPEQARKLAEEFPGVNVANEVKGPANFSMTLQESLPLDGLKSLDAETAKALASYGKGSLLLNALTTLDAGTAKELAEFKGESLSLNALTTLDADTAKKLADFKGKWLFLSGLAKLDADTARELAEFKGLQLILNGLATLDADTAEALAEFKGSTLMLNGLSALDVDTAKALAEFNGFHLFLHGLNTVDAKTAKALAEFKVETLTLNGLVTLDADTAKALAEFRGVSLQLFGLTAVDAETVKALAGIDGSLSLRGEVSKAFFANTQLTSDTALAWAKLTAGDLSGVTALESPDSVAIAQALAKCKGPLRLRNLKKISPKALTALIEKRDVQIPLIETLELIQEPDGSPTEDFIIPEGFQQ